MERAALAIIQEVDEDGEGVGKKEFLRAMMFSQQREENMDRNQSQPCVGNVFSTSRHALFGPSLPRSEIPFSGMKTGGGEERGKMKRGGGRVNNQALGTRA